MKATSKSKLLTLGDIKKGISSEFYFLKHFSRKIPLDVNYDLTWQCNLRCKHCYFITDTNELTSDSARTSATIASYALSNFDTETINKIRRFPF